MHHVPFIDVCNFLFVFLLHIEYKEEKSSFPFILEVELCILQNPFHLCRMMLVLCALLILGNNLYL